MISLWLALTGFCLMAVGFMLWPLWRHRKILEGDKLTSSAAEAVEEVTARLEANVVLFREHLAELDLALGEGRIDAAQHAQLKLEQERALLDDEASVRTVNQGAVPLQFGGKSLCVVALVMVCVGLLLYQKLGSGSDVYIQQLLIDKEQLDYQDLLHNRDPDPTRTHALILELEKRLAQQPDNLQYRFMLARYAMDSDDYAKAVTAYQICLSLDPGQAIVMGELAQAMFLRDNNRMSPAIADLAHKALTLDARNTTALGLAGIHAFQQQDFSSAVSYWQRAVDVMGLDAPGSRALQGGIAKAKQEMANIGAVPDAPQKPASSASDAVKIQLKVSLAASVAASPEDIVYVYARAWQGSRMPLAIQRLKVADLPATIILDETMAMSTTASLAQANQVEVVARISMDGSPVTKAGDWQASAGPLDIKSLPSETELVIAEKLTE